MVTVRVGQRRATIADDVSASRRIAVGQRVRKRKKRLIGSVAARLLVAIHLLLVTLIVHLPLPSSFQTVATMNDDGHGHDDNEQRHGCTHQNAQQWCHLKVECVTCNNTDNVHQVLSQLLRSHDSEQKEKRFFTFSRCVGL